MKKLAPDGASAQAMLDFEIFLTSRCNQSCSYCYTRCMRTGGPEQTLTFDQLRRFADLVCSDKRIRSTFTGPVKVEFSGGEPLLEFDLVKKTIDYIRSNKLDFQIAVATNGTLLTKERVDYFVRNNVDMRISLDGPKRINDRNRKFARGGGSVFDAVLANIKKGFPTSSHMDRCCVTPTLTPGTVAELPAIVDFFRHEVGVSKLPIGLEAYEAWSRQEIDRFRDALRAMIDGFLNALRPGADPKLTEAAFAEFPLRRELKSEDEGKAYTSGTLALHYDGFFYPSPDFVVAPPPIDPRYRVGDVYSGIDLKKLEGILSPMLAEIERRCEHRSGPRNPVEGYYWGIVNHFSDARIAAILESTSRINAVFHEETRYYLKLFTIYKRLYTTPGFGNFTHLPRHRADKEMKTLRLSPGKTPDIVRLRESVDFFLYSPGKRKTLVLDAPEAAAAPAAAEVAEGITLYAMMKAGYLEKKLSLSLRAGAAPLDPDLLCYLNEHKIRVERRTAAGRRG